MTVTQQQHLLAYLDYDPGQPDGLWGSRSKAACRAFQRDAGLQADGICGQLTQNALKQAVFQGMPSKKEEASGTAAKGFWKEIEYFTREEFRCRCGGKYCGGFPAEPEETLVRLVNDLRKQAGRPAHPSSGLRCPTWNTLQGGVPGSRHMTGKALDFSIEGVCGETLLAMAQADPRTRYAYVIEGRHVHVDVA